MSLRDRILLILSLKVFESNHYTIDFVHTIDLSVANNVICPITLKYSLEYTFILKKIIKNKELIKS
jgi:hypothetical protein